jgi:hypothetical protein
MTSYGSGNQNKITIKGVGTGQRGRPRGSLDKRYAAYGGVYGYRRYVSEQKRLLREQFQQQKQVSQVPQYEQQQYNEQVQMQEQQLAAQKEQKQMEIQAEADKQAKQLENNITVAEIRAAGYGAAVDVNQNQMSDYQDAMKEIRQTQQYQDQTNLQREKQSAENLRNSQKMQIEQDKIQAQKDIAEKQLQIARENKNRFDKKTDDKKKS